MHFTKSKTIAIIFVCICLVLLSLPNFIASNSLPRFLGRKINYGLDLSGGVQILLKVDFDSYLQDQMNITSDFIRKSLRKKRIRYTNLKIEKAKLSFKLKDPAKTDDVKKIITQIDRNLNPQFESRRVFVSYSPDRHEKLKANLISQTIEIIRHRIDETGTLEPSIQRQGNFGVLLQVPGMQDPAQLKRVLKKTAKLTFHLIDETGSIQDAINGIIPSGSKLLPGETKRTDEINNEKNNKSSDKKFWYLVKEKVAVAGDLLTNAQFATYMGKPVVSFTFNTLGSQLFADVTKNNIGKQLAIVLDNKVISAPVINDAILSGSGNISGNFTVSSANELALLLRAGALPAPLTIAEEKIVGPSLGEDSIAFGKKSGMIAVFAVVIFMIAVYGYLGIFASIAAVINLIFIIAVMGLLRATLTMPGIAGIILTMGMAVDTNVLIFERIREELKINSSAQYAIKQGFNHAFATILDSNLTTLIAAFFLYMFGSGIIRGFAVTLTIGILSSMFTAIPLTKMLIYYWINFISKKC